MAGRVAGMNPGLVQKRGLAPSRIAIRPQEMDAGEVPVPISEPSLNPDGGMPVASG
jgi:hypothetical protein